MKTIIIFGGTGYIGRQLANHLSNDYKTIVISRSAQNASHLLNPKIRIIEWNYTNADEIKHTISNSYALINLTGENISTKRWSKKRQQKLINSRIKISSIIIEAVNKSDNPPKIFIQGSAIGYYNFNYLKDVTEKSENGQGFLAKLVKDWENQTEKLNKEKTRTVIIRTGIIIGGKTSLIKRLTTTFNLYIGGHFGNGKQWFSWIHIQDQIMAIKFLLENENSTGKYNLTAPVPVTMKEFCVTFGKVLHKPSWFHIPAFMLKIIFGQMAEEILLNGNKVLPNRLINEGYKFKHTFLSSALNQILSD